MPDAPEVLSAEWFQALDLEEESATGIEPCRLYPGGDHYPGAFAREVAAAALEWAADKIDDGMWHPDSLRDKAKEVRDGR